MNIAIYRMHEDVILPTKRDEDGCYDLYAYFEEPAFTIPSGTIKLIPTGIKSAFDKKRRIAFRERGSNTKTGLILMSGQIDSGYRGEWFIAVYNTNNKDVIIAKRATEIVEFSTNDKEFLIIPYTKAICQFAIEQVPQDSIRECTLEELENYKSERGSGKLGSSGK